MRINTVLLWQEPKITQISLFFSHNCYAVDSRSFTIEPHASTFLDESYTDRSIFS